MTDPCRDWRGALGAAALGRIDPAEEIGAARAPRRMRRVPGRAARAHRGRAARSRTVPVENVTGAPAEPSARLAGRVLERVAHERDALRGAAHAPGRWSRAAAFAAAAAAVDRRSCS